MSFIQEKIIDINLGLKKEYKLIHISDVHMVTYKDSDSKESIDEALKAEDLWYRQRTWFADKFNEPYNEPHMIPSLECLEKLIDYINKEEPNAAILSGDIIDYYSDTNYEALVKECAKIKPNYVFSIGNHEQPSSRFKALTNSDIALSILNLDEFKILSLDNSLKSVSIESLSRFKEELKDNKPIIVVMHIPISTQFNKEEMNKLDQYFIINEEDCDMITKEFIDLLVNNDNVKAILTGHLHGFSKTYYAPGKLQVSASSGLIGMVNKIIIK